MKKLKTFLTLTSTLRVNRFSYFTIMMTLFILTLRSSELIGCASSFYEDALYNTLIPEQLTLFHSELGKDSIFTDYLFTTYSQQRTCLGRYCDRERRAREDEVNLKEWTVFLNAELKIEANSGEEIKTTDLSDLIYTMKLDTLEKIRSSSENISIQENPNSLLSRLIKDNRSDILDYIIFAKRCEHSNPMPHNSWESRKEDGENKSEDKATLIKSLISEGKTKYSQSSNNFLKLRYAFQMIRLANYSHNYDLVINLFDELISPLHQNGLYHYQALRQKAGAYIKQGNKDDAIKIWGLIFDQYPLLMNRILNNDFVLPNLDVWERVIKSYNGKKHQQATLWALRSLSETRRIDLKPLEELTKLEPKSSRTEFFLVRYINILEKNFLSYHFLLKKKKSEQNSTHSTESSKSADLSLDSGEVYLRDFSQFLHSVNLSGVRRPGLWHLAIGYSSLLLDREADAWRSIANFKQTSSGSDKVLLEQLKILEWILKLRKDSTLAISSQMEAEILPILKSLSIKPDSSATVVGFNKTMIKRTLLLLMAQKFMEFQQSANAYFCLSQSEYPDLTFDFLAKYTSPTDIAKILSLLNKTSKSPFEEYITQNSLYSQDNLNYMMATKYLGNEELKLALEAMKSIQGEIKNRKEISTTFSDNFYKLSTGLYDRDREHFPHISKMEFIQNLIDLHAKAEQRPQNAAAAYFQIANGYFHNPFWKYYFMEIAPWQNEQFKNYPLYESYPGHENYPLKNMSEKNVYKIYGRDNYHESDNTLALAWKYYDMSMTEADKIQDKELAANSCFMAAATQKEFSYFKGFNPASVGSNKDIKYYYEQLRNRYSETKFYLRVVNECLSFKYYLGRTMK